MPARRVPAFARLRQARAMSMAQQTSSRSALPIARDHRAREAVGFRAKQPHRKLGIARLGIFAVRGWPLNSSWASSRKAGRKRKSLLWIREAAPGSSDNDVLVRAHTEMRLLVTFDKDFGNLVFRRGAQASQGIVLFHIWQPSAAAVADLRQQS